MRILEVCPDYPPWSLGGAPQTFRALARAWTESGHTVTVVTTRPAASTEEIASTSALTVRPFELRPLPASLHEATYFAPMARSSARAFREFVRTEVGTYDLIVVQGLLETAPRVFLSEYRTRDGQRLFSLQYGISSADASPLLSPAARVAYRTRGRRLNARLANVVVFSRESEEEWNRYFGERNDHKLLRLPLGIDAADLASEYALFTSEPGRLDTWRTTQPFRPPFLLAVGRHDRAKGFDVAIDAFARIAAEYPRMSLVLAGRPTPFTEELRRDARLAGVSDRVRILGRVNDWERFALMGTCELFLIPSRKEGYGLNAVLARVLSKSTVATRTGAHEEILSGDPWARLVPPNDPAALAQGIREGLQSGGPPMKLDAALLDQFDIRHLADRLVALAARAPQSEPTARPAARPGAPSR